VQSPFAEAAAEFQVPESVLLGVSYQESGWEAHAGQYNTAGGYGPMNLTDVTAEMVASGRTSTAGRPGVDSRLADPALHTLPVAAHLTGIQAERLRTSERDNIRGGAALLARYERTLTGGTPADPADWYGAVARYAQSPDRAAAKLFADRVYAIMRTGVESQTSGGRRLRLPPDPALRPATGMLDALHLREAPKTDTECPATVDCRFVAAAPANGQVADRPADGMDVTYIVIHDTESSYDAAVSSFQKAEGADAHYVMRASDGAVTQMVPGKDIAFQAGNYWFNMHSIGIEHEGYAAHGATWYTEVQYENTADLVTYLAAKYHVRLDREHIIGHDNVPGPVDSLVSGMHWDPGPYWDWNRFMAMLGAPTAKGRHGVGPVGTAVTIAPRFASDSRSVTVCPADDPTGATPACTERTEPSNFLYVRTAPDANAPLASDPYLHPDGSPGTDDISDWSATVSAGQQFVVAGRQGEWTAVWYGGQKVWFDNPHGMNTVRARHVKILTTAGGTAAPLYGEAYPDPSEYPAGLAPDSAPAFTRYTFPAGQAYVATGRPAHRDDFYPANGTTRPTERYIQGAGTVYTIQYDHRLALVDATAVHQA
jgi:hypothetical protein